MQPTFRRLLAFIVEVSITFRFATVPPVREQLSAFNMNLRSQKIANDHYLYRGIIIISPLRTGITCFTREEVAM